MINSYTLNSEHKSMCEQVMVFQKLGNITGMLLFILWCSRLWYHVVL
jgi:hypothetical protein